MLKRALIAVALVVPLPAAAAPTVHVTSPESIKLSRFFSDSTEVTNPLAKTDKTSPIYGMPVLDVEKAKTELFVKRLMGWVRYVGVDNPVVYMDNIKMPLADAKKMVERIVKNLAH